MIIINPTPKAEFMQDAESCKQHRNLMQTASLQRSIKTALLEYQRKLGKVPSMDGNYAAASFMKLVGAQEFINILLNLAETEVAPPAAKSQSQLDHNA